MRLLQGHQVGKVLAGTEGCGEGRDLASLGEAAEASGKWQNLKSEALPG